jgi:predicted amidohydrolase YtcJ
MENTLSKSERDLKGNDYLGCLLISKKKKGSLEVGEAGHFVICNKDIMKIAEVNSGNRRLLVYLKGDQVK